MKKIIVLLMSIVLTFLSCISAFAADEAEEKYGTINVEFSDSIGTEEQLHILTKEGHVYVNAGELAARLGYGVNDADENFITIFNTGNTNLPYGMTVFFYNDTKVSHMLFSRMSESYKAPFESIHNEKGSWIPLEYSLLILNSGMMVIDDTVLIDIPEKKIIDAYADIMKNNDTYLFNWQDDFGYTQTDVDIIGASSHIVNQFDGLLKFDGNSWLQLFQLISMDPSSYDKKYGKDISMLMCTGSNKELKMLQEKIEKSQDVFSKDGKIGKLLSTYSGTLDTDAEAMYDVCNNIMEELKKGNSSTALYNRAYREFEKAVDKQIWFSKTGGKILDSQKKLSDASAVLDVLSKIAEVVQYGQEFASQDKFSIEALDCFLQNTSEGTITSETVKQSMRDYSDDLKKDISDYSAKRYFEENIDDCIEDAIKDGKLLGSQANMALLAWDLASDYVPFVSNGLSAADNFELALYASVLQADAFTNYQNYRNDVFGKETNITPENLYKLSQYCYVYLKSCYITREAALASLANKRESVKEKIQPLFERQNNINNEIAKMLVILKNAEETNDSHIYGFLPSDNEEYLKNFSDENVAKAINTRKELSGYLDSFNEMLSVVGGSFSEETGDHENWILGEDIQYGNYFESSSVDEITMDGTQYSLFGVYVGQNSDDASSVLKEGGWQSIENDYADYKKDNLNLMINIDQNTGCISSISFWKDWELEDTAADTASDVPSDAASNAGSYESGGDDEEGQEFAINAAKEKFSGDGLAYFYTGSFSYQGKDYYVVDVKQHVDGHYSRITQILVAKDGSYAGEGFYSNDGINERIEFYE